MCSMEKRPQRHLRGLFEATWGDPGSPESRGWGSSCGGEYVPKTAQPISPSDVPRMHHSLWDTRNLFTARTESQSFLTLDSRSLISAPVTLQTPAAGFASFLQCVNFLPGPAFLLQEEM